MAPWLEQGRSAGFYARELLHELKINALPIDPIGIASALGLGVREQPLSSGCDGLLLCTGRVKGILVNQRVESQTRKRFTVAHEIGHFRIHQARDFSCQPQALLSWDERHPEAEANEFAAELMMPEQFFKGDAERLPSMPLLTELAESKYQTSLTSTGIRYTKLTDEPCAVTLADVNCVRWMVRSRRFPFRSKVSKLSENSYAWDFFQGRPLLHRPELVRADSWFADAPESEFVTEHSIGMPNLGVVFSLLTCQTQEEDDFDSER